MNRIVIVIVAATLFATTMTIKVDQPTKVAKTAPIVEKSNQDRKTVAKTPRKKTDHASNKRVTAKDASVRTSTIKTPHTAVKHVDSCEKWRPLLKKYDWDINIAMAVMQQESTQNGISCNPNAANTNDVHRDINGNVYCVGSYGLMQISCHSGKVFDPERNIAIAWQKYKANGWQPWGAYTSGEYAKYLK